MSKVNVEQKDGVITMSRAGGDPVGYEVSKGTVEVDDAEVDHFLRCVPGSSLSDGNQSSKPEQKEA